MMFRRSSPRAAVKMPEDISISTRTWSISSRGSTVSMLSSSSSGLTNYAEQAATPKPTHDVVVDDGSASAAMHHQQEEEVVVGVAVGKEVKQCKANLMWVLSNMDAILGGNGKKKARVLLLHVHRPAKTIPFMGANFPADQLHESEVAAFRQTETEAMTRAMAKYRVICARVKMPAVCKVAAEDEGDDVAQGILSLVAQNGVTRLVIGAAADKRYSRKLTAPTSKTALSVQQQAPTSCSVWFVCKGNLLCTSSRLAPAATRKSDDEETISHHQVQLGTFLREQPSSSSTIISSYQQRQQLPCVPSSSAAAGEEGSKYNEMTTHQQHRHYDEQNKQDIQTIMAEAEKLRRENKHAMPVVVDQQAQQLAAGDHHRHEAAEQLEAQLMSSKRVISDLQAKLSEAHCMLFSLERDQDDLRRQRDAAVREAAALRDRVRQLLLARGFTELSLQELQQATNNLDGTLKLGRQGGGYGSVYKGVLRRRHDDDDVEVAVKVLNPHGMISSRLFQQQVEDLRKLRHPNLVPLLGACSAPEAPALVYEFLPGGGSLEDDNRMPPLLWPERTRIAAQICSALVFLHQNNMVHGDLKPGNVLLLDAGEGSLITAKLADYGLCRLLEPHDAGAVMLRCSANSLAYMDPEFLATGELRASSDVYAFGVLLLRLLTGRPAMGLVKQVLAALAEGRLPEMMDASAGYPQEEAQQLAHLGVKCCEMAGTNRPELAGQMVAQKLRSMLPAPSCRSPITMIDGSLL